MAINYIDNDDSGEDEDEDEDEESDLFYDCDFDETLLNVHLIIYFIVI